MANRRFTIKTNTKYISSHQYFPRTIEAIINNRDYIVSNAHLLEKQSVRSGLNSNLLLSMASFIESLNKFILSEIINKKSRSNCRNSLFYKLVKELRQTVQNGSWNDQNKQFEQLFNDKLSEIITDKIYAGINCIFAIRNIIIHGNNFAISEVTKQDINEPNTSYIFENGKSKRVYQYMKNSNLMGNLPKEKFKILDSLLTDEVVDHFISVVNSYISQIILSEKLKGDFIEVYLKRCKIKNPASNM